MPADTPDESTKVHLAPLAGGGSAVTVYGDLDLDSAPAMGAAVDEALAGDGPMVIDLRACGFVDSTGIAVLARAAVTLKEQGRELTLRGVQERVMKIFDLCGLSSYPSIRVEPAPGRPTP